MRSNLHFKGTPESQPEECGPRKECDSSLSSPSRSPRKQIPPKKIERPSGKAENDRYFYEVSSSFYRPCHFLNSLIILCGFDTSSF